MTHSGYTFRAVQPNDLDAWWQLRLYSLLHSPEAFGSDYQSSLVSGPTYSERGYFDNGPNQLFAAFTADGELVAQAATTVESGKRSHIAHIISVYTHPHHRRQGLAQHLVQTAIRHLQDFPEITSIRIAVNTSNLPARNLYENLGFVAWGEEPDAIRTADGSCHNELHMVLTKAAREE